MVLLLSGLKLIDFPGATYVIAAGLGIGVIVLVAWAFLRMRYRPKPVERPA
jgi:hypothetical protein